MKKSKVLFLCQDNATRSLMAEVIFRHLCGDQWEVHSAGQESGGLHPLTLSALQERGFASSGLVSKTLDQLPLREFDLLVTLSHEAQGIDLSEIKTKFVVHLPFENPAAASGSQEQRADAFRRVRDQIYGRLSVLAHRLETQAKAQAAPVPFKDLNSFFPLAFWV
ncbi:MAG: hypothetical protein A2600_11955 [Candidatus Lambdaproteobacteria bacterium RIFOXYD1_FULL_56_27]|nr:MAG: hypothetical protein A2426_10525 [Candidatus Lambdaproteobacteria bacterium RIFOXYC1_FULL_56_13]OGH09845.1 MAG: hypothetical protein A2600_11955 [Candidatus Lambdaproteobacteria bacterium RIFOXYD1_FULL_56_27]